MGNGYSRIPALWEQGVLRSTTRRAASAVGSLMESREEILLEESFRSMLTLERRRAERSRKPFVLMLLDASPFIEELRGRNADHGDSALEGSERSARRTRTQGRVKLGGDDPSFPRK